MSRHLIVSQYFIFDNEQHKYSSKLEDVSWTSEVKWDELWVYNKAYEFTRLSRKIGEGFITFDFGGLKNVGREQHSYLDYIVTNYFSLPDIMIFSQANPFVHEPNFLEKIDELSDEHIIRKGYIGLSNYHVSRASYLSGVSYTLKKIFGVELTEKIMINGNGLFAASKERILHWPLEGWQQLRDMNSVDNLTLEVYTSEAMWTYLLGDHFEHCNCNTKQ